MWYYEANDSQVGPVDENQITSLIGAGIITSDTRVWKEGMPDWVPAGTTELASLLPSKDVLPVSCPGCSSSFEVSPEIAGQTVECPACSASFTIPNPASTPPPLSKRDSNLADEIGETIPDQKLKSPSRRKKWVIPAVVSSILLIFILGGGAYKLFFSKKSTSSSVTKKDGETEFYFFLDPEFKIPQEKADRWNKQIADIRRDSSNTMIYDPMAELQEYVFNHANNNLCKAPKEVRLVYSKIQYRLHGVYWPATVSQYQWTKTIMGWFFWSKRIDGNTYKVYFSLYDGKDMYDKAKFKSSTFLVNTKAQRVKPLDDFASELCIPPWSNAKSAALDLDSDGAYSCSDLKLKDLK